MDQAQAQDLVKTHGSIGAAARAAGMPRSTFLDRLKGRKAGQPKRIAQVKMLQTQKGKGLEDFRALYDKAVLIPAKIQKGLEKLGPDHWEYEVQFAKLAGVSLIDIGHFRDSFAEFVVVVSRDGRRVWAGSVELKKALEESLL